MAKHKGLYLPSDAIEKMKYLSGKYKVKMFHVLIGSYTEGKGEVFTGNRESVKLGHKVPHHMMSGLASHLRFDMTEYKEYYIGPILREIRTWPKCSNGRHRQRMEAAYPGANPALWNIQAVMRGSHLDALAKFGVFNWSSVFKADQRDDDAWERAELLSSITTLESALDMLHRIPYPVLKAANL